MRTWPKRILVIVVILLVVGLIAWPKIRQQREAQPRQQASAQNAGSKAIPVEVAVITPRPFTNTLRVTGSIMANEMLELKNEVPGILETINFREGQDVQKGQLLFTIRNNDLQAQLQKARARQKLVQDMESRQRQLLEREAVSQEEYDQAVNDLQSAEADIELLQAQIAKTRVVAPFSGTVGLRFVSEGSYVAQGTSIASMYDLEPAKIDFSIPGKYSGEIKKGTQIRFNTDGSTREYSGEIYAVEPQIDPATRTIKIRGTSPNQDHSLLPGQFARVFLTLQEMDEALLVPTQSVVPELNGHKVFVVKGGKVVEQQVEIGQRTAEQVQIVTGLQAGDSVLTTGILQVRGGSPVQVTGVHQASSEARKQIQ